MNSDVSTSAIDLIGSGAMDYAYQSVALNGTAEERLLAACERLRLGNRFRDIVLTFRLDRAAEYRLENFGMQIESEARRRAHNID